MHKTFRLDVEHAGDLLRWFHRVVTDVVQWHGQNSRPDPYRAHAMAATATAGFLAAFPVFAQVPTNNAAANEHAAKNNWWLSQKIPKLDLRPLFGFSLRHVDLPGHWRATTTGGGQAFAVGYEWHNVRLERTERSAISAERARFLRDDHSWIDSGSSQLSFSASPSWTWRIGRGTLGDVDQLANQNTRRSTISATYVQPLAEGDWQTTLAWGRRAHRWNEPVTGYLVESVLRFHRSHSVFGTLEQVGSDDPARANAPSQQQLFKMNKLTVGYFHHVDMVASVRIDVGGFITRHLVPSEIASSYGSTPTRYMMFIRLKLD